MHPEFTFSYPVLVLADTCILLLADPSTIHVSHALFKDPVLKDMLPDFRVMVQYRISSKNKTKQKPSTSNQGRVNSKQVNCVLNNLANVPPTLLSQPVMKQRKQKPVHS